MFKYFLLFFRTKYLQDALSVNLSEKDALKLVNVLLL